METSESTSQSVPQADQVSVQLADDIIFSEKATPAHTKIHSEGAPTGNVYDSQSKIKPVSIGKKTFIGMHMCVTSIL